MDSVAIDGALKTAQGIGDFGMMAIAAGFFILLSAFMMVFLMRWTMHMIEKVMKTNETMLAKLDAQMDENNDIMKSIAEGLRPETLLRVKTTSGMAFELAMYRMEGLINTIRAENHIANKDATEDKISNLVTNLHQDMNSKMDYYSYRGRKLSSYTNDKWVEWMEKVITNEIYAESGFNEDRMHTNVTAVFDKMKLDFYHRLNDL